MTGERWKLVKELLHQAMQLAPEQRARFLAEACLSDDSVRAEVQSLLMADENVRTSFLQAPPGAEPGGEPKRVGSPGGLAAAIARYRGELPPGLPDKFGPYQILGSIGKGGMGEVYRARDTRLGRSVAVKILPADMCRDPGRHTRFEHEARAASALNHPNIVSVYDIGSEGGIPFIVTELIEGESLRGLIAKGPVPAATLVEIATQLVAGLTAAHAAGVVHRDLKPDNIMLTPDMRVKILDFGLAKHTPQRLDGGNVSETQSITAPGLVMGTIGYLAPEQVRGEIADARSDIFSLGAVLYELAAGKRPFGSGNAIDVLSAILRDEPEELRVDIPPALDRIIRRCLEKDAQRRFQDAASLAAALRSIGKISTMRRVWWAIERKRGAWGVAAAVLVVGCGVGLVSVWMNWQALASHAQSPQQNVTPPAGERKQQDTNDGKRPRPAVAEGGVDGGAKGAAPQGMTPDPQKTDPAASRTAVIEVLAGRPWKFTGDGMPARQVALRRCDDVKADRAGNLYVTDWASHAIVKIDRNGILHVVAGPDSPPDDRPADPHGLVIDNSGVIYFSQVFVIRKLLPSGHIVPFAGNNTRGFTPDGAPARGSAIAEVTGLALAADGSVIFSEFSNQRVRRVDLQGRLQTIAGNGTHGFGGDGGPAQQASLAGPRGLALDRAGNLFIADPPNGCVRKVTPDGRITTFAGHGVAGKLVCPTGLVLNQQGDLFIADPCQRQVFVLRNGHISLVGGIGADHKEPSGDGGPATSASFDQFSLALDEQENLLISGPFFGHIYRITHDGIFSIIAGSGLFGATHDGTPAREAVFQEPSRLAVDGGGNVFLTDFAANRIYRLDRKGTVTEVAGYGFYSGYEGEDTPARNYLLKGPRGVRVDPHGNIVFADTDNNRVREVTADGRLRTLAGNGKRSYSGDGGRAVEAALNAPMGLCLDNAGNIYIADTDNHRVRKVTPDGRILTVAGNGTAGYSGDGEAAERAALNTPMAVEADPNGDLYIADMGNRRIRRVSGGVISTLAGESRPGYSGDGGPAANARLEMPSDLALGPDQQLFILDRLIHRIRRIDLASGIITTFAGNGESTTSGDGGPAIKAGLGRAAGIAADGAGNVYVTDLESKQVRIIRPEPH